MVSEKTYRLNTFKEHFSHLIGRRIVLFGKGVNAKDAFRLYANDFKFLGYTECAMESGYLDGVAVLSQQEMIELEVEAIIIATQIASCEAVYQRILPFCKQNSIVLYDMYGNDLVELHKSITRQKLNYDQKCEEEFLVKTEGYDVVSIDLMETFFMRTFPSINALRRKIERKSFYMFGREIEYRSMMGA